MVKAKTQTIQIINRHPKLAISLPYLKKNTNKILAALGLKNSGVEITLEKDAFVKKINKEYMHKSGTTDVLSFPQVEVSFAKRGDKKTFSNEFLGDILISLDQASRQAKQQNITLAKEVLFLVLHSILHLIGYDHADAKEQLEMQKLESKIWRQLYKSIKG